MKGKSVVNHIHAAYHKAYILTKPLSNQSSLRLMQELRVEDVKLNCKIIDLTRVRDAYSSPKQLQSKNSAEIHLTGKRRA